uniref:NADH-ubiquinone oxidoreductase chain 6 n=1 Tax=Stereobalanus canadensis TaxID=560612 RepID=A0A3S7SG47_9BILA|nr:NADH dehydrogenase subunit 6 [Stereobalanus canadensis]AXY64133.1 NADH dehydrogenase subunit 6 [Stereobalanus canadensis]
MLKILISILVGGGSLVLMSGTPYFSALGLVFTVCGFGGLLMMEGGVFVGLVLILMYVGGMMVVFVYTVALAADRYPVVGVGVTGVFVFTGIVVTMGAVIGFLGGSGGLTDLGNQPDFMGCGVLYSGGGYGLLMVGFGLLVCLLGVLSLVRGFGGGALRALGH